MKSFKRNIFILFVVFNLNCNHGSQNELSNETSDSYFIKKYSELYHLIQNQDTFNITNFFGKYNNDINLQTRDSGKTLLLLAIENDKRISAIKLLQLGANPNLKCKCESSSALILAVAKGDSILTKEILEHKGDPNIIAVLSYTMNFTPLEAAIRNNDLILVNLLLKYGADLYLEYQISIFSGSPIKTALYEEKIDLISYWIFNGYLDLKKPLGKRNDNTFYYLVDLLRNWTFPLNSEEYRKKMEIVNFLKTKNIDYRQSAIPSQLYQHYPSEYLEKY